MNKFDLDEVVDAVVIGTGAGGAPLLSRLAAAKMRVVALEAGSYFQPSKDFATDEYSQSKIFWLDERLSAGGDPIAFGNNNSGCGVGGSTIHYTAYTPRPQPDDFNLYSEFGVGRNWPIQYKDIEKYLEEVESFIGVSGPSEYPWGPERRTSYRLPALPLNAAARFMERGAKALNIKTSAAPNAALSMPFYQEGYGWRPACVNRGYCQAGCNSGAKASTDVTYIPLAIHYGAEIRPETFATSFERDGEGKISAVIYHSNGANFRQRCRNVFLCGGAVETPRLLLINGLANSSGQVGRNFMTHTGAQVWGRFEEETNPWKGIPGSLISEDYHRPENVNFAGGFLLQSIGVMPLTYAMQVAKARGFWGNQLKKAVNDYNHIAGINILGECLPSKENFIELSDELDNRGLPKPRVHFTCGKNENDMTAYADKIMRQVWEAAGAEDIWSFPRNPHLIGTCVMGDDPTTSVVNSSGQSFDIPNLYISDNSIFSSSLSVNPALTLMSISLKIADDFIENYRKQ